MPSKKSEVRALGSQAERIAARKSIRRDNRAARIAAIERRLPPTPQPAYVPRSEAPIPQPVDRPLPNFVPSGRGAQPLLRMPQFTPDPGVERGGGGGRLRPRPIARMPQAEVIGARPRPQMPQFQPDPVLPTPQPPIVQPIDPVEPAPQPTFQPPIVQPIVQPIEQPQAPVQGVAEPIGGGPVFDMGGFDGVTDPLERRRMQMRWLMMQGFPRFGRPSPVPPEYQLAGGGGNPVTSRWDRFAY